MAAVSVMPASRPNTATPRARRNGVQETLALLLHFHRQQFEPVFPDGQQPPREMLRRRGQLPEAGGGFFHNRINRGCGSTGGRAR